MTWRQPKAGKITMDDTHALVGKSQFRHLQRCKELPLPLFEGKMWRKQVRGVWWLYFCSGQGVTTRLILRA